MGVPRSLRLFATLALGCLFVLALTGGTQAGGVVRLGDPTRTDDPGPPADTGSLRDTIIKANAAGGGTINLNPINGDDVFTLSLEDEDPNGVPICDLADHEDAAATGDLDITSNITIHGNGATIDASSVCNRIFDVQPGATLTLDNVNLEDGQVCAPLPESSGAGIRNRGTLSLDHVTIGASFAANDASDLCSGGGLGNELNATARITDSTIGGDFLYSDGIYGLYGNGAYQGGGIYNRGTLTLSGTTVSGNYGWTGVGGGIFNTGTLTAVASTLANNEGTGLYESGGSAGLQNVTIADNDSISEYGGGIENVGGTVSSVNSIVAANTGGSDADHADCQGDALTTQGHNLYGTTGCTKGASDIVSAAPGLGHLAPVGGATETIMLLAGSPAIDHGDNASFRGSDQRGIPACCGQSAPPTSDIGAFEYVTGAHAAFTFSPATPFPGESVSFTNGSTDDNSRPLGSFWNFGDYTSSTEAAPSHGFDGAGAYPVLLDVWDS